MNVRKGAGGVVCCHDHAIWNETTFITSYRISRSSTYTTPQKKKIKPDLHVYVHVAISDDDDGKKKKPKTTWTSFYLILDKIII